MNQNIDDNINQNIEHNMNQNIDDNINQNIEYDINQNSGDNNSQILHVNEIPIVLEAEDNIICISKDDIPIGNHNKLF